MGLYKNMHLNAHTFTHLSGTITIRKSHNSKISCAVLPNLKVFIDDLEFINSWNLKKIS